MVLAPKFWHSILVVVNCSYIVLNALIIVVLYFNDLDETPTARFMVRVQSRINLCMDWRTLEYGWERSQCIVEAPELFLAYNMFMNGVDRFYQLRASNEIERRYKGIPIPIFTLLMDARIINAYALYRSLLIGNGDEGVIIRELKWKIAESLVHPQQLPKKPTN